MHVAEVLPENINSGEPLSDSDQETERCLDFTTEEQFLHLAPEIGLGLEEAQGLCKRFLPPGTLADSYRCYSAVCSVLGMKKACWQTFHSEYRKNWESKLGFRGQGQHAKCDCCEDLKQRIRTAATLQERHEQCLALECHHREQFADRRCYYRLRDMSQRFYQGHLDAQSICIIIDGMDQSKFRCPRNLPGKKTFADLERPTLHMAGAIIHGLAELYLIADADVKKDPDTELETLMMALDLAARSGHDFPRHVNVQGDNCVREMKNQWVIYAGATLILFDVLDSITYNYLRTGHTHEDIGDPACLSSAVAAFHLLPMSCSCLPCLLLAHTRQTCQTSALERSPSCLHELTVWKTRRPFARRSLPSCTSQGRTAVGFTWNGFILCETSSHGSLPCNFRCQATQVAPPCTASSLQGGGVTH